MVVVVDTQEIGFGHKLHIDLEVEGPVVLEAASGKQGVVGTDNHLVEEEEEEGKFEVHRLAEYVQDKNAVIQEDVEDRTEADLVHLVAHKSELWQEEIEVVAIHNHLVVEVEAQMMGVPEGLAGPVEAEILFELLLWTVVVVVVAVVAVTVVVGDNSHWPV